MFILLECLLYAAGVLVLGTRKRHDDFWTFGFKLIFCPRLRLWPGRHNNII